MGLLFMKKIENFKNCLNVLKTADFDFALKNEIYRTGIIGQFNLCFELAWKALQEILREYGVIEANTGSPREILQLAYKYNFLDNEENWLLMLKNRNLSTHIYNEEQINKILRFIQNSFIPDFLNLEKILNQKLEKLTL